MLKAKAKAADDPHSTSLKEELMRVQQELQAVKVELMQADNEIEDLEKELFEAQQGADRTPGALLFFAALQDEGAVPTIQQLVLQLGHLKSFVDGSEHLDFPTMRKRLQVCVECVPNLSKFISKYSGMVQKWSQDRYKVFASRNLAGGNADLAMICPLCSVDSRMIPCEIQRQVGAKPSPSSKRSVKTAAKGKTRGKSMSSADDNVSVVSQSESLPSLPALSRVVLRGGKK